MTATKSLRRVLSLAVATVGALLLHATFVGAQGAESQQPWQSIVLNSVGEGWVIDQGTAEVSLSNGKFSATMRQANPGTKVIYDLIALTGSLSTDKSLPRMEGVSGYAVTVMAQYKNSSRSAFKLTGTYRRVELDDGGYDEVIILHEDYNVITMSRRSHPKR